MMWSLRAQMPQKSPWRTAQFATIRLRLIKIAARIIEMKAQIKIQLPTATPIACQTILRLVLPRMIRLVT
jgi:hypothetical protein